MINDTTACRQPEICDAPVIMLFAVCRCCIIMGGAIGRLTDMVGGIVGSTMVMGAAGTIICWSRGRHDQLLIWLRRGRW